jgi:hypothetical protein
MATTTGRKEITRCVLVRSALSYCLPPGYKLWLAAGKHEYLLTWVSKDLEQEFSVSFPIPCEAPLPRAKGGTVAVEAIARAVAQIEGWLGEKVSVEMVLAELLERARIFAEEKKHALSNVQN